MTTPTTKNMKGTISSVQVVWEPTIEFGVQTEWAVRISFRSPTGDASDFMSRSLPCLSREQAVAIADYHNRLVCPELVGRFAEKENSWI